MSFEITLYETGYYIGRQTNRPFIILDNACLKQTYQFGHFKALIFDIAPEHRQYTHFSKHKNVEIHVEKGHEVKLKFAPPRLNMMASVCQVLLHKCPKEQVCETYEFSDNAGLTLVPRFNISLLEAREMDMMLERDEFEQEMRDIKAQCLYGER